jgi:hypothetical protein
MFSFRLREIGGGGLPPALLSQSAYSERPIPPLVEEETPLPIKVTVGTHRHEHRNYFDFLMINDEML